MEAIEFVVNYENYLNEIEQVIKPEYIPAIERLRDIDPHDLVSAEIWFMAESHAMGFVWSLFIKECHK